MNRMIFSDGDETAVCHVEKKLSAPSSGSQREGSSFFTLFSATNTVIIAGKALRAGSVEKLGFSLGGPAGEPAAPGGLSCKNRKESTFPGCVPGSALQEGDSQS